jgi:hypothetical protein
MLFEVEKVIQTRCSNAYPNRAKLLCKCGVGSGKHGAGKKGMGEHEMMSRF